ncbi:hypothetical protein FRB95_007128 [Tulasnella sp. JGI-2019a]|nr:hypothetical protein FRB95_007128 [Tulasnella sp. JGI-2019a]
MMLQPVTFTVMLAMPRCEFTQKNARTPLANVATTYNPRCYAYNWILVAGSALVLYTMEVCLTVRIHAMYGRNKRLLYLNLGILATTMAATVILTVFGLPKFSFVKAPPGVAGCYGDAVLYEAWLFCLALRKGYQDRRQRSSLGQRRSLLGILITHNLAWFAVTFTIVMANLILFRYGPTGARTTGVSIFFASSTIVGSRLLVDTRRAWKSTSANWPIRTADATRPTMEFAAMTGGDLITVMSSTTLGGQADVRWTGSRWVAVVGSDLETNAAVGLGSINQPEKEQE